MYHSLVQRTVAYNNVQKVCMSHFSGTFCVAWSRTLNAAFESLGLRYVCPHLSLPGWGQGSPPQYIPGSSRGVADLLWSFLLATCSSWLHCGPDIGAPDCFLGTMTVCADSRVSSPDTVQVSPHLASHFLLWAVLGERGGGWGSKQQSG